MASRILSLFCCEKIPKENDNDDDTNKSSTSKANTIRKVTAEDFYRAKRRAGPDEFTVAERRRRAMRHQNGVESPPVRSAPSGSAAELAQLLAAMRHMSGSRNSQPQPY